jgi:hypothetical protein
MWRASSQWSTKKKCGELYAAIVLVLNAEAMCRKIILSPWSCFDNLSYHTDFNDSIYLGEQGNSVYWIRECIRDFAFMRHTKKFRVI